MPDPPPSMQRRFSSTSRQHSQCLQEHKGAARTPPAARENKPWVGVVGAHQGSAGFPVPCGGGDWHLRGWHFRNFHQQCRTMVTIPRIDKTLLMCPAQQHLLRQGQDLLRLLQGCCTDLSETRRLCR
jgi:hypothetical protein